MKNKLRPIAIYLPQFHPIPENDAWWGKGFTEWTNVAQAKPLFKDHYQPHFPADLGFYDLRLSETREAQAQLAKDYGIYGFCYYHYWFNGRRILERPFQEVFDSGKPDFPFMLCWANENWTRVWDGNQGELLLQQIYSEEDDRQHIKTLLPFFKDPRYIKIDDKPVFALYRSALLPNVAQTIKIWREEALKEGINLYLCRFESSGASGKEFLNDGFDAAIEFQPFSPKLDVFIQKMILNLKKRNAFYRIVNKLGTRLGSKKKIELKNKDFFEIIRKTKDYNSFVDHIISNYKKDNDYVLFPGATPSWDNTSRMKDQPFYFINANPSKFKEWLKFIKDNFHPITPNENLVFLNAWNEWAEGCHLEPCQKWGCQYLEAVKAVF